MSCCNRSDLNFEVPCCWTTIKYCIGQYSAYNIWHRQTLAPTFVRSFRRWVNVSSVEDHLVVSRNACTYMRTPCFSLSHPRIDDGTAYVEFKFTPHPEAHIKRNTVYTLRPALRLRSNGRLALLMIAGAPCHDWRRSVLCGDKSVVTAAPVLLLVPGDIQYVIYMVCLPGITLAWTSRTVCRVLLNKTKCQARVGSKKKGENWRKKFRARSM